MSTVTSFVCVTSNCVTITEHFSQYNDALMYEKRQGDNNINTIPEETPTKAPNGVLEAYGKRQIPEQVATKAPNGETVVYEKRQSDNNINTIPEETPTKAPNGVLEAYGKRQIPE